jgi:hypothetical protein
MRLTSTFDPETSSTIFNLVLPLRIVTLKKNNLNLYNRILNLESHLEERLKSAAVEKVPIMFYSRT